MAPLLPDTIILESNETFTIEIAPFKYEGGIGGGVALKRTPIGGGNNKIIGFTPWQFCHFVDTYVPFIQDVFEEVSAMLAKLKKKIIYLPKQEILMRGRNKQKISLFVFFPKKKVKS